MTALRCRVSKMSNLNSLLFGIYLDVVSWLETLFVFLESFWRAHQTSHSVAVHRWLLCWRRVWCKHVQCGAAVLLQVYQRAKCLSRREAPCIILTAPHFNGFEYSNTVICVNHHVRGKKVVNQHVEVLFCLGSALLCLNRVLTAVSCRTLRWQCIAEGLAGGLQLCTTHFLIKGLWSKTVGRVWCLIHQHHIALSGIPHKADNNFGDLFPRWFTMSVCSWQCHWKRLFLLGSWRICTHTVFGITQALLVVYCTTNMNNLHYAVSNRKARKDWIYFYLKKKNLKVIGYRYITVTFQLDIAMVSFYLKAKR